MSESKLTIGNGAIILSGEGKGVSPEDITKTAKRFRALFGVRPDIRIRGRFGRSAMTPKDAADPNSPDVWDFTVVSYYQRVSMVGRMFVAVTLESPIPGVGAVQVRPDLGTMVAVRFALPE